MKCQLQQSQKRRRCLRSKLDTTDWQTHTKSGGTKSLKFGRIYRPKCSKLKPYGVELFTRNLNRYLSFSRSYFHRFTPMFQAATQMNQNNRAPRNRISCRSSGISCTTYLQKVPMNTRKVLLALSKR